MLDAGVKAFGIFADDDEIDAGITGGHAGKIADGPYVGEELEAFAEFDVDAGKSAADGGGDGAFEADVGALDGIVEFLGNVFLVLRVSFGASGKTFPLELEVGGFENANCGGGDLRADAVAGNKSNFVCHEIDFLTE